MRQTACFTHGLWASNRRKGFPVRFSPFRSTWLKMRLLSFVEVTVLVVSEPKRFQPNCKRGKQREGRWRYCLCQRGGLGLSSLITPLLSCSGSGAAEEKG